MQQFPTNPPVNCGLSHQPPTLIPAACCPGLVCCVPCSADIPGGSILGTTDERLRLGVDCLMSQVPFWLPGQAEVVTQLVTALEHLQVGVCCLVLVPTGWHCSSPASADSHQHPALLGPMLLYRTSAAACLALGPCQVFNILSLLLPPCGLCNTSFTSHRLAPALEPSRRP